MGKEKGKPDKTTVLYNTNLRGDIVSEVNERPKARVHSVEWRKVMAGDPVEINPSIGHGFKVMTVDEWAGRWKRNEDFPDCQSCGSKNTKEHHFTQVGSSDAKLTITFVRCSWTPDNSSLRRPGAVARRSGRASSCAWTATASPGENTAIRTSKHQNSTNESDGNSSWKTHRCPSPPRRCCRCRFINYIHNINMNIHVLRS